MQARRAPPPATPLDETVPEWFKQLHPLTSIDQRLQIGAARLVLRYEPTLPLAGVWHTVRQQLFISGGNIVAIYVLLGIIIFANKRMLHRLNDATRRFQEGEHEVRLPVRGTLEARMLATTFNAMAQQVQLLVQKLETSRKKLSQQLDQTLVAQEQLQAQKDRIEVTLASIGDAVITTDLTGKIETINEVAQQLTGVRTSALRARCSTAKPSRPVSITSRMATS